MGSLDRSPHSSTGYGKLLGEGYHKLDWNPHPVSCNVGVTYKVCMINVHFLLTSLRSFEVCVCMKINKKGTPQQVLILNCLPTLYEVKSRSTTILDRVQ